MQRGLLVEFSCNSHSLLDSPLESFTACEIICPWVTSGCYNIHSLSMFFCKIFFNLNPYFYVNSKLITKPIIPLSNNISMVTPSCVLILSSPIFTVTFLNKFLFKLHLDISSTALLLSVANLL